MSQPTMSAALIQAAHQIEYLKRVAAVGEESRKRKEVPGNTPIAPAQTASPNILPDASAFIPKEKKPITSRSKAIRLEQNRRAARESRRRKKAMIEELQRSLTFFSKSNAALKQQNEDLTRRVLEAHGELARVGEVLPTMDPRLTNTNEAPEVEAVTAKVEPENSQTEDLTYSRDIAVMQTGATMQAMANFQQAAHAAMEAAAKTMKAHGVVVTSEDASGKTEV